ncbi:hypothetical protein GQ43DRAFT_283199 [Delitschia confertaspora ATCC 74209]|uniref:Uncharacterized protein n=1 Tax=Delitschia confertaspora ATCC 74209 TaxID=1513339 RepID=A0A9P4JAL5_9PLEO|nr:hypothetical protein GQ43DRAFT_283199 [Delitschia confertaspora ATCC 74209]
MCRRRAKQFTCGHRSPPDRERCRLAILSNTFCSTTTEAPEPTKSLFECWNCIQNEVEIAIQREEAEKGWQEEKRKRKAECGQTKKDTMSKNGHYTDAGKTGVDGPAVNPDDDDDDDNNNDDNDNNNDNDKKNSLSPRPQAPSAASTRPGRSIACHGNANIHTHRPENPVAAATATGTTEEDDYPPSPFLIPRLTPSL